MVARTTPEECIDDCLQDAWLRLYERLEADPQALGPNPDSKSPAHARSFYVNRIVWDAHKDYRFGPWTQTYRKRQIPESVLFERETQFKFKWWLQGVDRGLDTVLWADEHHRDWVAESDIVLDLESAIKKYLAGIKPKHLPRRAMAILCVLYKDITHAQGAVIANCSADTIFMDSQEARLILQVFLRDYQENRAPLRRCKKNTSPIPA